MTSASLRPRLLLLSFTVLLLLNIDYTILRSLRNTLAVVDLGKGAHTIPVFELFGALPGAILTTAAIAWLMNRFSIHKVFFITISVFISFFLIFTFGLYPILRVWKESGLANPKVLEAYSMSFFVMGELWKPCLAALLFWGLINRHVPIAEAKKLYAPLTLGSSLGGIAASPLIRLCSSETAWKLFYPNSERWMCALTLMILLVSAVGVLAAFLYYRLWLHFSSTLPEQTNIEVENEPKKDSFSLKDSISTCLHSPQLKLLSWIVIADYIAYSLGEVIFLEVLRIKHPQPLEYNAYLGDLTTWSSLLTVFSALCLTPVILQRYRWSVAALVTPICLLITEGAFFIFLRGQFAMEAWFGTIESHWLSAIVIAGSVQYCLCRAAKYTLFDSSKELAFVMMPKEQKMKGKLIVDGICARLGRGGASALSIGFIHIAGGVIASSLLSGIVAIGVGFSWCLTAFKLGKLIDGEKSADTPQSQRPALLQEQAIKEF